MERFGFIAEEGSLMSEHYSIDHLAHKVGPFDIRVGYFYEDLHPSDLFDNSTNPDTGKPYYDTDEMAKRIDANIDAWFGFWCKVYYEGHEVGYANLGGLYYEDDHPESVIEKEAKSNDHGWYKDFIEEALDQARKETGDLYKQMQLDFGVDNDKEYVTIN